MLIQSKPLQELTKAVLEFEKAVDRIMREPESAKRGERLTKALNFLTSANQSAMLYGLKYTWPKINKLYEVE